MNTSSWRMAVIVIVLLASLAYILPSLPGVSESPVGAILPKSKINLGLDLKGGMHLTLGVDVQKAVENSLLQTGQNLREESSSKGIAVLRPRLVADRLEFLLPKADQRAELDKLVAERYPELELETPEAQDAGGLRYFAQYTSSAQTKIEEDALDQVVRTIRNRIDQFGVSEPDIRKQAGYRIQIQLPGLSDPERAIQLVGQTAQLTFHLVRDDVPPKGTLPPGTALYPMISETDDRSGGVTATSQIVLDRDPLMTGEDITDARPAFEQNKAHVALAFNKKGADTFERITGEHLKKRMAIVLDGKVYSAPVIQDRIAGGRATISGASSLNEAQDLAIVLRAGSLPAPVSVLEERSVGPSLGQESIEKGLLAAAVGAGAVAITMPIYYGLAGIVADVMLIFTISMLMAGLAAFGATLTLPGIAGVVLTIGMSVDANVLIFERIREELRRGLSAVDAVAAGFERASISIIDSNVTTVIAAAILYQFGTGPVRGFAVTLTLGILASMFTAIFVSKAFFAWWLRRAGGKLSV